MSVHEAKLTLISRNKVVPSKEPLALGSSERRALVDKAKELHEQRSQRADYFTDDLFGEPSWDMLLGLYIEAGEGIVAVSRACQMGSAPLTTGQRWIAVLEHRGLVRSSAHPNDKRVRIVEMTEGGRAKMDQYLADMLHI